jgi:hypothetical protein
VSSEALMKLDLRLSRLFGTPLLSSPFGHQPGTYQPSCVPTVYPIKSCKGFEIKGEWEIGDHGFVYDREWMIVDETGSGINQKKVGEGGEETAIDWPLSCSLGACLHAGEQAVSNSTDTGQGIGKAVYRCTRCEHRTYPTPIHIYLLTNRAMP